MGTLKASKAGSSAGFTAGAAAARSAVRAGSANTDPAFQRGYKSGWDTAMADAGWSAGRNAAHNALDGSDGRPKPGRDSIDAAKETLASLKQAAAEMQRDLDRLANGTAALRRKIAHGDAR